MSNNFKATVQLVTEVDYSSIEKVNPNEVAKRLSKAYGPVTKKLFRDPFLQLSKEYAKSNLKFYDKNKLRSFSKDLQMEYAKSAVAYADARAKLDKDASNVNAKRQEKASAMAMRSIEKQYKTKMDEESALLDKRKKISEKIDRDSSKSIATRLSEASGWFLGTLDKGLSDKSDLYRFGKEQFTATKEFAEVELDEASVKGLKAGATKLDQAAGSLAKSSKLLAGGAAATVGILAMIGKLLWEANEYGVEFNKTMLEGSSYVDLGATNAKDLIRNLGAVRSAAEDLSLVEFRTSTEENLKVLTLLNQQAVSYRALAGDIDNTKVATTNLTKVIRQAHYFSNLLGLSLEEVTEKQAVLFKDLGYNAETMDDAFHSLARGAEISGFNTKRFYSMVLQSTSGMAAYNMRIEEASSLLNTLTSALGTNANELLQTLTKGFSGEGLAQSFKRFLMMGRKAVNEVFSRSSENMAEKFAKDFRKNSTQIIRAFRDSGIKLDIDNMTMQTSEGQKKMISVLSKLSPKKQAELIARIREDAGHKTANQFKKLVEVSQGMSGSFEGFARGSSQLDMTSKLIAQLRAVEGTIKVPLYAMNKMQLEYYSNATGINGEQLQMLRDVSLMLHGNYDLLKQDLALAEKGFLTGEDLQKKQLEHAKSMGATITKVGDSWKIVAATTKKVEEDGVKKLKTIIGDAEIKNAEQLASTQEDLFKQMLEEPLTEEMKITQEIVRQTRSLNKVVGSVTNSLLGQIYDTTNGILNLMPGNKLTEAEKANKQAALEQIALQEESIKKSQFAAQQQVENLENAMKTANKDDRAALKPQHDAAVAMEKALGDQVKELENMRRGVINTTESGKSDYFFTETGEDKTVQDFITGGAAGGDKTLVTQASEYAAGLQEEYKDTMNAVAPALENYLRSPENKERFGALEEGFNSMMSFFGDDNEEILKKEEDGANKRQKESEKLEKKNHKDAMEVFDKMWNTLDYIQKADALKAVGSLSSLPSELRNEAIEALATTGRLPEHILRQLSPEDRTRLYEDFGYNPPVDDFIIQGNTITPIDKRDTLVGYKTGGALTQARDSGRVATGGSTMNHITINAKGATVELIMEALKRAGITK